MMNITTVLQHLEQLDYEIEEALTAVEGVAIAENLDLDRPQNSRALAWSTILQCLKLADYNIVHSLVEVKEIERNELVLNLKTEDGYVASLSR